MPRLARRRIPPMPIEELRDHPKIKAMPVSARGMIWELCAHFWETECVPFARNDDNLMAIMGAHRPTYRHWKATILSVFDDIRPRMEYLRDYRDQSIERLRQDTIKRRAAQKALRLRQQHESDLSLESALAVRSKRNPVNKEAVIARQALDDGGFMEGLTV